MITIPANTSPNPGVLHAILCQISHRPARTMADVDHNTDRILEWMDRAASGYPGIDMVIFPECSFQGGPTAADWIDTALTLDSDPIRRVCEKCRELEIWGVFNPWIKPDDGRFIENTAILVNDRGEIVHTYVKMNPWIPYEPTAPGHHCGVVDGPKGTRIALMICADSKYQELWREARLQGANLVIHISNWPAPYEHWHKLSNQAGAFFNELTVLAVNSVGMDDSYVLCGNSMVVDTNGKIVAEAPVGHEWLLEAVVNPGAAAAGVVGKITSNLVWEATHRGASCPDNNGVGLGLDDYTAYNAVRG